MPESEVHHLFASPASPPSDGDEVGHLFDASSPVRREAPADPAPPRRERPAPRQPRPAAARQVHMDTVPPPTVPAAAPASRPRQPRPQQPTQWQTGGRQNYRSRRFGRPYGYTAFATLCALMTAWIYYNVKIDGVQLSNAHQAWVVVIWASILVATGVFILGVSRNNNSYKAAGLVALVLAALVMVMVATVTGAEVFINGLVVWRLIGLLPIVIAFVFARNGERRRKI